MVYTKKDISAMFEDITNNSLVAGNTASLISSQYLNGGTHWTSYVQIYHEDGAGGLTIEDYHWEDNS